MGEIVPRRIFRIVGDPAAYQNKQIGFNNVTDADLNFKMFCTKDDDGNILKLLAKDKPARVKSLDIVDGQYVWDFDISLGAGTLSFSDTVSEEGKLEFSDDILLSEGIKARFADNSLEVSEFASNFGNSSIMAAINIISSGGISGLDTGGILFGDRSGAGTIEQDPSLTFDDDDQIHIGSGTQEMILAWDRIIGGDTISVGASVGSVLALNGNGAGLNLTGDMESSLVIGPGSVNADRSIIAGIGLDIGQGTGHAAALGESLLCLGTVLTIDAQHGSYIGSNVDVDGADYSSGIGDNISVNHDFSSVRGRYAKSHWDGACFFGTDRYNGISGNSQGVGNWILNAETTGDETVILRSEFSGSNVSFTIPDGMAMTFRVLVQSAVAGAVGAGGIILRELYFVCWNNGGYHASDPGADPQKSIATRSATWDIAIDLIGNSPAGSGEFNLRVTTSGTSGETISHVARIDGIISQTSIYASS